MIALRWTCLVIWCLSSSSLVWGFHPTLRATPCRRSRGLTTALEMAKQMRNKQAELAKKMAMAKKQKDMEATAGVGNSATVASSSEDLRLSNEEIKEKNDRLRFEELLKKQSTSMNSLSSDGYLNKQQEEAEIDAYQKGLDRLFEGDPAPTEPFEDLINVKSSSVLGDAGTNRLIPWFRGAKASEYLIIISDPRVKSQQLRETAKTLSSELRKDLLSRLIIINADSPSENKRWMKKNGLENRISVYSDERREWMRSYTALGEDRWSMTMFIIADERLQKVAREMEAISATKTIQNAAKSMENRRL